jgi:thiamine pyrophosphokinase
MDEKTYLIIANGELVRNCLEEIDHSKIDFIVALDGAVNKALQYGIQPDIVIGDLDSIPSDLPKQLPDTEFLYEPSQDKNDLEKALIFCQQEKAQRLILLGLTGGRADHFLNNFSVLARYMDSFNLEIFDHHFEIFLVTRSFKFNGAEGQIISLIPIGKVTGITTRGLKYSLKEENLEFGIREGLSNVIINNPVEISIKTGLLIIFVMREKNKW